MNPREVRRGIERRSAPPLGGSNQAAAPSPIGSVAELQLAATEWHEAMNAPMFDGPRVSRANDALHAAVDALSEAVRNEKSAAGLNPLPRDLSADEAARIDAAGGPLTVEEAIKAFSDKWVVVNSDWQALEVRTDLKMIERAVRNEVASGLNDSLQPESESDLRHVPASNEASTHEVGREACAVCGHPKYISPTLPREPRYETHQVATFSGDLPFSRGIAPIRVNICYGGCLHEPGAPNYHAYEEASR